MTEYNELFAGLVLNGMQAHATTRTLAGVEVSEVEAKLFAKNITGIVAAVLATGVKLAPDAE